MKNSSVSGPGRAAFLGLALVLSGAGPLSPAAPGTDFAAVLCRAQGQVLILPGGATPPGWKKVKVGMGLAAKDKLKTGPKSLAQILLDDGSFYLMKPDCEIGILELVADRKAKSQQASINIDRGTFFARVSKLGRGSKSDFRTPTTLAAVRGTQLAIEVEESGTTHLALYEGRLVVTDFATERFVPRDQGELLLEVLHEVSMKANQGTTVTKTGISKPRALKGKMKEWEKELPALEADNEKALQEEGQLSYEESQARRAKARQEAIKSE
jgi:hypothetical protein